VPHLIALTLLGLQPRNRSDIPGLGASDWVSTGADWSVLCAGDVDVNGFVDVLKVNGNRDLCVAISVQGWKAAGWTVPVSNIDTASPAISAGDFNRISPGPEVVVCTGLRTRAGVTRETTRRLVHSAARRRGGPRPASARPMSNTDPPTPADLSPGSSPRASPDKSTDCWVTGPDGTTRVTLPLGHASPGGEPSGSAPLRLGRYTLVRVLGEGGMGTVYEAQQESPRRTVALKVIRAGYLSPELLRRFGQEAQVLGRLQHPGIAQVFESGMVEDDSGRPMPFFAMEFIRGVPLTEHARSADLGVRAILELVARTSDAVYHAHQKGVIHRDLKPGNILVDEGGQPKVLDFGVARATDSDLQQATLQTDVGQLVGTVPYMSPEQVSGDPNELDTRSDVYALGVIAYELLTGRMPHDLRKKMIHEAARIIREEEPTRLSQFNRALRGDVETIIAKALEKDKSRRYQSAESFASDIRRCLRNEPIAARPASTWYQARKFARRNRGLVAGLAAAIVCIVAGLAFTTISRSQAIEARADAEGFVTLMVDQLRARFAEVGRLDALADVADSVADYYDRRGEASLDAEQIAMFAKSLQLSGEASMGSGQLDAAAEAFGRQRRLLEGLVERHRTSGEYIKALGAAHFFLGDIARRKGDFATAESEWHSYLEAAERLVAIDASDPEWQLELAYAHSNFVQLYSDQGDAPRASAALATALQTKRRLVELDPTSTAYRLSLANSLTQQADVLESGGDLIGAERAADEALSIIQGVVAGNPSDAGANFRLAVAHVHVGELRLASAELAEAIASFRAMQDVVRKLIEIDPSNSEWQRQMAVGHRLAAVAAMEQGDRASSELDLGAARRILLQVIQRDQQSMRWRSDLVRTEREASRLAARHGDRKEARAALQRARRVLEDAPPPVVPGGADTENVQIGVDAALSIAALDIAEGQVAAEAGELEDARGLWQGAIDRVTPYVQSSDRDVHDLLAHANLLLGRPAEAERQVDLIRAIGGEPSPDVRRLLGQPSLTPARGL
jgi:tetratricopeptide (TPR) repeat protein/predicted Ser/Thr protein kinase